MSLAVLLLTATVAAEPPVLNGPDIPALANRFAQREAAIAASADASVCKAQPVVPTADAASRADAKKLGELPRHHHFMTVLRKERGCDVAVIRQDGRNHLVPLPKQGGVQPLETRWSDR